MMDELIGVVVNTGKSLVKWRDSGIIQGSWHESQFKAQADVMVHNILMKELAGIDPKIPVVSEEDPSSWKFIEKEQYFIIDPIDGTASYSHGFSGFVTQVALIEADNPEISVIYAPVYDELFTAQKGKGAFLNGKKIIIRNPQRWDTLIDNYPEPRGVTGEAFRFFNMKHYIESGSISLKICKIADGTADIFFKNVCVRTWDLAAPHLVIDEAGGFLFNIHGKKIEYRYTTEQDGLVAANSLAHAKCLISWYSNHYKDGDPT